MKTLRITVDGKVYEVQVETIGQEFQPGPVAPNPTAAASAAAAAPVAPGTPAPKPVAAAADGAIVSPLGAVVVSIDVKAGQAVKEGDRVVTLEAMKMNTYVNAPAAGTIGEILVAPGDSVEEGQALATLK